MPSSRGPVVFGNFGVHAFMGTELMLRERLGQLLPEGVAIDAEGRPTRDPAAAVRGALLPFGGYKGFGLAFIVQALGVADRSPQDHPAPEWGCRDTHLDPINEPAFLVGRCRDGS
jgi:hypothetical protein